MLSPIENKSIHLIAKTNRLLFLDYIKLTTTSFW